MNISDKDKQQKILNWKNSNLEFMNAVRAYDLEKIQGLINLNLPKTDVDFISEIGEFWGDGIEDDINTIFIEDVFFAIKNFIQKEALEDNINDKFLELLRVLINYPIKINNSFFVILSNLYIVNEINLERVKDLFNNIIENTANLKKEEKITLDYYYKSSLYNKNHDVYLYISAQLKSLLKIETINHRYLVGDTDDLYEFNKDSWLTEYYANKKLKNQDDNIIMNGFFIDLIQNHLEFLLTEENEKNNECIIFAKQSEFIIDAIFNDYKSLQNINVNNINYMALDLYWTAFSEKHNVLKGLQILKESNQDEEKLHHKNQYDFKIRMVKLKLVKFNKNLMLFIEKIIENQEPIKAYNWFKYINLDEKYYKQLKQYIDLQNILSDGQNDEKGNGGRTKI